MLLRHKNILVISPDPWKHIFVSKHHYAVFLSRRDNRVFFLNPPGKDEGVKTTEFPNVSEVYYKGFPIGLRFYPAPLRRKIISRMYRKLEEVCSVNFDVVWSFDNSVFLHFCGLPDRVFKISHIVDYSQDFQTKRAASSADICFTTSDPIRRRLSIYNDRVYKINHGYHAMTTVFSPGPQRNATRITAVYAGNLSMRYIDWSLILKVVVRHPEVDFLFVGPNSAGTTANSYMQAEKARTAKNRNVSFVGTVTSLDLQKYYQLADLLIVAYREKYQRDQVSNPHKVMEYLGSGKVIVATHTSEFSDLDPLIVMSERNAEWPSLFSEVVQKLTFYNSGDLQTKRKSFANDNTYGKQIDRIEQIINRE